MNKQDVYNSNTGMFEQQTVTGYKNPAMGNYQTFDGKNINHAGIGFKGIAGTVMEALGFGPEKDEKGYYDGQIAGTFTGFKPGDFKNMGEFFKTKKDRQKFMDDNKKTLDAIKKQKNHQKQTILGTLWDRGCWQRQLHGASLQLFLAALWERSVAGIFVKIFVRIS